jgi:HD-GYP domain-containing protein (c-di-GMP phosphodiesterase class II)
MRRIDARTERRLADGFARALRRPGIRETFGSALFAALMLIGAVVLATRASAARELDVPLALGFTLALAILARVEFSAGAGYAVATQAVFVPMLLLLPTPVVPLLGALAFLLSSLVDALRGRSALARVPVAIADATWTLPPALVIIVFGAQEPAWSHWPVYVVALVAQLAVEAGVTVARSQLCLGMRARDTIAELGVVYRVDALLSPLGLLAAIAARDVPAAALLSLAPVALIAILAREREAGIAKTLELGRAYRGTALLLRDVLEEDDEYTGRHTEDVVGLSVQVAERLGVDEDVRQATELGALLHDIGKIVIPDAIINKAGPLDDAEWALMRTHTIEGQRMLDRVGGLLGDVGIVVRASHERWDGRGYPDGLAGDAIPLPARIVSACDAFNAMTTDRSYRRALPLEVATQELRDNAGTQFDPAVVEALLAVAAGIAAAAAARAQAPVWELGLAPAAADVAAAPVPAAPAPSR